MAYVDTDRKVIILYTHKTGTHTIRHILREHGRIDHIKLIGINNHPSLEQIRYQRPEIGDSINQYEVYAFYREPIERHLSFMKYASINHVREPNLNMMQWYEKYGFFVPQVRWLKHDTVNINLLDYRQFDSECIRVFDRIGITLTGPMPIHNASGNTKTKADLTTEETTFLKDLYKDDYQLLESKGIYFD